MKAIINANVFDGRNSKLKEHVTIVIRKNLIHEITDQPISLESFQEVIDAGGRTVIPGLTDCHVHLGGPPDSIVKRIDENAIYGAVSAKDFLMRGFTTIRDAGSTILGIKMGIDKGIIDGPRIFPAHGIISQTCGHADFRRSKAETRLTDGIYLSPAMMTGEYTIADGTAEVLRAVRERLFLGASHIKIMAGGGLMSEADPVETVQYTLEELKAAVDAASDFGTYVMAHLYTSKAMQRAAKAGVKSFEHGQLMDEETAKIIADNGIFLDPCPNFEREPSHISNLPAKQAKYLELRESAKREAEYIEKYNIPILYGTDANEFKPEKTIDMAHYKEFFGSFRGIVSATGAVNDLIKLTTYQNPYPEGKIGVLEAGAFADLLIVDGNPVEDLEILADPHKNILLIMKDAKIYKNIL